MFLNIHIFKLDYDRELQKLFYDEMKLCMETAFQDYEIICEVQYGDDEVLC